MYEIYTKEELAIYTEYAKIEQHCLKVVKSLAKMIKNKERYWDWNIKNVTRRINPILKSYKDVQPEGDYDIHILNDIRNLNDIIEKTAFYYYDCDLNKHTDRIINELEVCDELEYAIKHLEWEYLEWGSNLGNTYIATVYGDFEC